VPVRVGEVNVEGDDAFLAGECLARDRRAARSVDGRRTEMAGKPRISCIANA
jgi:hypothetical protein